MKQLIFLTIRKTLYIFLGTFDVILQRKTYLFILSYHGFSKDLFKYNIDPKQFEKQIEYLKQTYDFISLDTLEKYLYGNLKITRPSVVITIDDGYKNVLEIKKVLERNNIIPSLFVLSNPDNANYKQIGIKQEFLSHNDIKKLINENWIIGSHTKTHPNLLDIPIQESEKEIHDSKTTLEKQYSKPVLYFAYPRGKYKKSIVNILKKNGYKLGLTMDDGFITDSCDPLKLPRVGVDKTHSFSEFKYIYSPSVILFRKLVKNSPIGAYL